MAAETNLTRDDWAAIERAAGDMSLSKWAVQKWRQDGIPHSRLAELHRRTGISVHKMAPDFPSSDAA